MLFGRPSLLAQCVGLDVRLSVPSRTWSTGRNVPQAIDESSDTPQIHCAQHVQQSVDMSIQLPAGLQCDPVQMAEVLRTFQQVYVLFDGAWLYSRVNVANTVHLSKHHSYRLQSLNRVRKDRPPESHLIADYSDK